MSESISFTDLLLNESRISPSGNGVANSALNLVAPTSDQKLWASVILGFVFAIISSPVGYSISALVGSTEDDPHLDGLLVRTIIFIVIVRIILW